MADQLPPQHPPFLNQPVSEVLEINESTVEYIVTKKGGDGSKVINLVKSIERKAEEESVDPCLIAMPHRPMTMRMAVRFSSFPTFMACT